MQGSVKKVRGIYVVAAIVGGLAVALGLLVASWMQLPARPSADPAFASRIVVPEEFRRNIVMLRKGPGPSTEERDGYELYRESYVSGWNDCLESFVADRNDWDYALEDEARFEPWLIGAPDEINAARRDGWRACDASLKEALKTRSEADLRATLAWSPGGLAPLPSGLGPGQSARAAAP